MDRTKLASATQWLRGALAVCALCCSMTYTMPAQADEYRLTIMEYGLQGFSTGALIGASSGYLMERNDGWSSSQTRNLLIATGIGAVGGAGIGLLLGLLDQGTADQPAAYILRGATFGATLGGLVGAATGAITWLANGSAESILFGASLGVLIGAGAGIIFGIVEGAGAAGRNPDNPSSEKAKEKAKRNKPTVRLDVGTHVAPDNSLVLMPGLRGQF